MSQKLEIVAGRYYKTRDGRKAFVSCIIERSPFQDGASHTYPVCGYIESGVGGSSSWVSSGMYWADAGQQHDADLVAEWRDPATEERVVYLVRNQAGEVLCSMQTVGGKLPLCWRECAIGSTRVTVTEGVFA